MKNPKPILMALSVAVALGLSACAGGTFTGPVEVTRFVAERPAGLGEGTIALRFAEELENEAALDAFRGAISDELSLVGYTVIGNQATAGQIATVTTSRSAIEETRGSGRGPVDVGVGAGGGSFGGFGGVGVGINLGGGGSRTPRVISELSIAIAPNVQSSDRQNLWEARAQFPTSINSPYAPVDITARTLAAAVFRDFPGGNGETVSLEADELLEQ